MRRVLVPFALSRRPPSPHPVQRLAGESMGTTWSVLACADPARTRALHARMAGELATIDAEMSTWRADSDLTRFNRAIPGTWVRLPERTLAVLAFALDVARETRGAFDPTVGELVDLWGFGPSGAGPAPSAAAVAAARAAAGWQHVSVDAAGGRARRAAAGRLDFSGVAKGYAADRLAALLHLEGIGHHLVEVGGELRGSGQRPDGQPWWVAIERPPAHAGENVSAAGVESLVALHELAVATSGDYRRFRDVDGARFAHTVDPSTGRPLANDMAAVTVLHERAMAADAYATALMVMGATAGARFAGEAGLAALLVAREGNRLVEHVTARFAAMAADTPA